MDKSHLEAVPYQWTDAITDGFLAVDEEGTIHSLNSGAERIFGYQKAEALGQNVSLVMPELEIQKSGGAVQEVTARHKDGSVFAVELGVGETMVHDRRMYFGILRDITTRKEVAKNRLERIASLERSNQDLNDFAYLVSHDLKEPLRGLFNNSLILKEDYQALVDEAGVKRLDRICFLCTRMERLINDLLYFSRVECQELAYRKADLNAVVGDIIQEFEFPPGHAEGAIRMAGKLPILLCDATRLGEVFRNLIQNAIQHNDKAEKLIEIGWLDEYIGERCVLYVRDNGMGIARKFQSDVFMAFKRLQPEDGKLGSSGLGLTFAKKIVECHGGKIWLESESGKGTTVFFTIQEAVAA